MPFSGHRLSRWFGTRRSTRSGQPVRSVRYPDLEASNNDGMGIALDSSGAQVVVGSFQSDMTCGPHKVSSAGQWDVFVWKLKPP